MLGRQPEISIAELEAVFGDKNVHPLSSRFAKVKASDFQIDRLGGTVKYAEIVDEFPNKQQSFVWLAKFITNKYTKKWRNHQAKITLGISAYDFKIKPREVQKIGITIKSTLKKSGVSVRIIPNETTELSTATSHNNKLGLSSNKTELLLIRTRHSIIVAESKGTQNITSYTQRDRHRPKRDAFVGMLPPKLAQIIINLSGASTDSYLWDPFCGTGTILQETLLAGIQACGSDLSQKMVDYTIENLEWLSHKNNGQTRTIPKWQVFQADATTVQLSSEQRQKISHIACETYLGQPFSAPPSRDKLKEVTNNCNHIISGFLKNIHPQISQETSLCIAVPAWKNIDGSFTHLPLIKQLEKLGYQINNPKKLIYHREDQVVARELLILKPIMLQKP